MTGRSKQKINYNIGVFLLSFGIIFLLGTANLQAQTPAATPCDPEYFKSLKSRAWLEAQREITQNQNLIFKPDSVLEYTCFDGHLKELVSHSKDMFSENPRWGGTLGVDMGISLSALVNSSLITYLQGNFERKADLSTYDLLGGRLTGLDHNPPAGITGGNYNCDIMNRVWMEAKCWDFVEDNDNDGFYTLNEYAAGADRRFLPSRCPAPTGLNGNRWNSNLNTALVSPPWSKDSVNPFIKEVTHLTPDNCSAPTAVPIETGVEVFGSAGQTFKEKICVMPGCYYNRAADKCLP